jgi:hypothetical protein
MYIRNILLLATICLSSMVATGQENQGITEAQRVVLDSPEVITLEITPITRRRSADVYEKVTGPFKPGSKIEFELVATNTSIIPLDIRTWDIYGQNKPRLFRDNQELPYREEIKDLLKDKYSGDSDFVRLFITKLTPNERKVLESFDLSYWYEPFGPGHYELSVQHRFIQGGKWVESASIVFEVEEKKDQ